MDDDKLSNALQRISAMEVQIDTLQHDVDRRVTKDAFKPVALITYGLAGAVMLAVLGSVLTGVVHGAW